MKKLKLVAVLSIIMIGVALLLPDSAVLAQPAEQVKKGLFDIGGGDSPSFQSTIKTLVDVFLFLIGATAVIMLIYGGFRYVTSAGDTSAVSAAKNTILYAVVGLIIAIAAYGIADFVAGMFEPGDQEPYECQSSVDPHPSCVQS